MNWQRKRNNKTAPTPHTLIPDERRSQHRPTAKYTLISSAFIVGILAAFIWLSYTYLNRLADADADIVQQPVPSADAHPTQSLATPQQTAAQLTPATEQLALRSAEVTDADAAAVSVRPAANAAPTVTPTAIAYVDSIEAVVGLGGAMLWNSAGSLIAPLEQGVLVSAKGRSTDGNWVYVELTEDADGWIAADDLIIFDAGRLQPQAQVIIPITPTPTTALHVADASNDDAPAVQLLPSPTDSPQDVAVASQLDSQRQPTARIALDGSRLNVRAGPGPGYQVIAKAMPDEMYAMRAVSADGLWVQIALPDSDDGFGWVASEFLVSDADFGSLPVSSAVSAGAAYAATKAAPANTPTTVTVAKPTAPLPALPPVQIGPPSLSGLPSASGVPGLHGTLVIQQEWGGSIYVYDLDSGDLRLLTGGFDPSVSPDGSKVVFTREGGENGIYTADIMTGEETLLFSGREHLRSPKYSPNGDFIVFERGDESIRCIQKPWRCRVSVPSPDGDMPEHEIQPSLARIRADGSDYWDPMDLPYARVPDWSEEGIVYQSLSGLQIAQNEPNVDTQEVYFDILKQYEMDPDWQPSGGVIAFQQREINHWEIYIVNPDGSDLYALTRPESPLAESFPSNVSPAWSPDGQHIVFLSNRTAQNTAGDWGVWVMKADGSNKRRLPIELPFVYTYISEQMLDWGP